MDCSLDVKCGNGISKPLKIKISWNKVPALHALLGASVLIGGITSGVQCKICVYSLAPLMW